VHITDTMAFMFETRTLIRPTRFALESPLLQGDYGEVWSGLRKHFVPPVGAAAPAGAAAARAGATRGETARGRAAGARRQGRR
jgi:hypothetical protein